MTLKRTTLTLAIAATLASAPAHSMLGNADTQEQETKAETMSERERIAHERNQAEKERLAKEKAEAEKIRKERERAAAERAAAQKRAEEERLERERRAEEERLERERQEKERQARLAKEKAAAEKEAKIKALATEALEIMPQMSHSETFPKMRSIYGKMWKLDKDSGYTKDLMHENAEKLVAEGNRTLSRIADAYNEETNPAQKEHYAKQVPEFANLAEEFLKESHFYLKESTGQTKLKERIAEFRASHDSNQSAQKDSPKEKGSAGERLGVAAGKAGDAATDVGSKVAGGAKEVGGKLADRFKNACWMNCDD